MRADDIPLTTSAQHVTIASDELLTIKNIGTVGMPYGTTPDCLDGSLSPGEARTFSSSQYIKAASVGRQSTIARVTTGQVSVPGAVVKTTDVVFQCGRAGGDLLHRGGTTGRDPADIANGSPTIIPRTGLSRAAGSTSLS